VIVGWTMVILASGLFCAGAALVSARVSSEWRLRAYTALLALYLACATTGFTLAFQDLGGSVMSAISSLLIALPILLSLDRRTDQGGRSK
jgi:preprotein translocase subunit SecF